MFEGKLHGPLLVDELLKAEISFAEESKPLLRMELSGKIVNLKSQFHYWVEEFLLKDKFVEEQVESNHFFYRKAEAGEPLQQLLKNGKIINALLKVSGRKLRY